MIDQPPSDRPAPTPEQLLRRLARCHALLQDADALIDPEAHPDLDAAIGKELGSEDPEGHCGIPGCELSVCPLCGLTSDAATCPRCAGRAAQRAVLRLLDYVPGFRRMDGLKDLAPYLAALKEARR